jgi:hypothetical protein
MRWPSQYNNNCIALEIQLLLMKVLYTERKVSVPRTKSFCTPNEKFPYPERKVSVPRIWPGLMKEPRVQLSLRRPQMTGNAIQMQDKPRLYPAEGLASLARVVCCEFQTGQIQIETD